MTPFAHRLEEEFGLYALFTLRGPQRPPEGVAIVGLDESSLERLRALPPDPGSWPTPLARCSRALSEPLELGDLFSVDRIPRALYACLVDRLAHYGAQVIVLDVAFRDDPGRTAGSEALAHAIARHGRVVLLTRARRIWPGRSEFAQAQDQLAPLEPRLAEAAVAVAPFVLPRTGSRLHFAWTRHPSLAESVQLPVRALEAAALPALERVAAASSGAHRGFEPARDRRDRLVRAFLALSPERWASDAASAHERRLLEALVRAHRGPQELVINFYGPPGTIPHRTLFDLLTEEGPEIESFVAAKVVFVGAFDLHTALAADTFPTVFSDPRGIDHAGVELAATVFANLRDGVELHRPPEWARAFWVGGFAALASLLLLRGTLAFGLLAALLLAAALVASAVAVFSGARLWLPLAFPLGVVLPAVVVSSQLARYLGLARWLGILAPRSIRAAALGGGTPEAARGTIAELTVLFTDIVGSTALAELLGPTAFKARLDDHFAMLARLIETEGGEIVEFLGDGVMAYWGGPSGPRDHATRACRAARAIACALERDNRVRSARGEPSMRLRIGINTGEAVLGTLGGSARGIFTVTGDVANAAQRIEQLGKTLCPDRPTVAVLVGERTANMAGPDFDFTLLGAFPLKGRAQPERVFRLAVTDKPVEGGGQSTPADRSIDRPPLGMDKARS